MGTFAFFAKPQSFSQCITTRTFSLLFGDLNLSSMISEILPEDKRRLHELEEQVTQLESSNSGTTRGGGANIYDVQMGLDDMSNRLVELEALVNKEPKARRDDYRRRVTHLKSSFDHVKKSFDAVARRQGVNLSLQGQRAELFAGGADRDANYNNPNFDLEAAEAGSLTSSSRMVGDYLAVGQETLAELHAQRDRLKGVQKKVFDMLNYLGLSNSIMKAVTDREVVDKYIVGGGMAVVTLVVFLLVYYR